LNENVLATHHEDWLTSRALEDKANLPALVAEYWERAERRKTIGEKLSISPDEVRDNMCDYSDETIDLLVEARERNEGREPSQDLYEVSMNALIDHGATEAAVCEVLHFAPRLELRAYAASKFVAVLHSYPQLEQHEDYSLAPQHVRDQCMGLLTVAIEIWGSGNPSLKDSETDGFKLINNELIEFIMIEPLLASRIATAITERETVDIETLRLATSDVMSNGAL
jgi:hypothetical protein